MFREWLNASAAAAGIFTGATTWSRDLVLPEPKVNRVSSKAKPATVQEFAPALKAAD
jgi:hypothetical protein